MSQNPQTAKTSNLSKSAQKCMEYLPEATNACRRANVTTMSNDIMNPDVPTTPDQLTECCVAIEIVKQVKLKEVQEQPAGQAVIENFFTKLEKNVKHSGQKNIEASLGHPA